MNIELRKSRILTVDDEHLICQSIKVRLRMAGFFKVESHTQPLTTIDKIIEFQPELVLLDIFMPDINGLELLEEINNLPAPPKVIVLSAADMDTKYRALELGALDFINKPIDSKELVVRVQHALQRDDSVPAK